MALLLGEKVFCRMLWLQLCSVSHSMSRYDNYFESSEVTVTVLYTMRLGELL